MDIDEAKHKWIKLSWDSEINEIKKRKDTSFKIAKNSHESKLVELKQEYDMLVNTQMEKWNSQKEEINKKYNAEIDCFLKSKLNESSWAIMEYFDSIKNMLFNY